MTIKQKSNQADLFSEEDQPQNAEKMENEAIENEGKNRIKKLRQLSEKLKFLKHGTHYQEPETSNQ